MKAPIMLVVGVCVLLTAGMASAQPPTSLASNHGRLADRFLGSFDLNHDGKVTRDELNKADGTRFAAAAHGASALTSEQFGAAHTQQYQQSTARMFRRLDWNGDGKLTLDEYAGPQRARFETMDRDGRGSEACPAAVQKAAFTPGSRSSFGRARFCAENDLNRDGNVTHAELDSATAKKFATMAANGKTISMVQFSTDALARWRDTGARLFKRLDADRDGRLSLAEFSAFDQKLFARLDRNKDGTVTRDELTAPGAGYQRRG